jgi:hypothetical protein
MAGKMQNYLNWFQRHHTAEEYSALVAGDVKIQKFLDRQNKIPAAIRALDDLSKDIGKKVMIPALQKASEFLAAIEKGEAPTDAGTLKQSIGSSKAKYYPATFCGFVASGPRRGYARAVQVVTSKSGKSRLKRMSKKFTNTTPTTLRIKNPVAYARFVQRGRHAIFKPKSAKAFPLMIGGGTFFARRVKAAPAKDFMASAEHQSNQAATIATEEMNSNLQTLLS